IENAAGHWGSNKQKDMEKTADVYSFILNNLGVTPKLAASNEPAPYTPKASNAVNGKSTGGDAGKKTSAIRP
ncbi:MAG: hypothetical protein H7Y12_11190, partial [Sphingobacteriaceae bacterium]|nr:hypothetical protein [Cytophagaceae bacterium]